MGGGEMVKRFLLGGVVPPGIALYGAERKHGSNG